jgi:hypothetical protein
MDPSVAGKSYEFKLEKGETWKARKEKRRMVVGDDVEIGDIANLMGRTTVGNFCGKSVTLDALKYWLVDNWQSLLRYCTI